MTQSELFAARLKNARIMKGFSMDELVAAMGNIYLRLFPHKLRLITLKSGSSNLKVVN